MVSKLHIRNQDWLAATHKNCLGMGACTEMGTCLVQYSKIYKDHLCAMYQVSGTHDRVIHVWDVETSTHLHTFTGHRLHLGR